MKEQPLLHTCRERVSQLSFVFEPGLRLSTVTTHPSSYPCIDIATDLISDCFKERRDVNSFGNGPEASEATWTSSRRGQRNGFGRRCAQLTSIIILISYFDFWVLAKKMKKWKKKIVNWVTLYLAWLLKPLKWYKKGKMIIEKNTYVLETC